MALFEGRNRYTAGIKRMFLHRCPSRIIPGAWLLVTEMFQAIRTYFPSTKGSLIRSMDYTYTLSYRQCLLCTCLNTLINFYKIIFVPLSRQAQPPCVQRDAPRTRQGGELLGDAAAEDDKIGVVR